MARPMAQCGACVHYLSPLDRDDNQPGDDEGSALGQVCDAFPAGIPDAIWGNHADHRQPLPGDNGIVWESNGLAFPEYAMDPP